MQLQQDFEFQLAEFAVGEDEEVAAAAGGIEETELGQFALKLFQSRGAASAPDDHWIAFRLRPMSERSRDKETLVSSARFSAILSS